MTPSARWPRGQRGQALPLGLALVLFGVIGGLVLYNTGQSATDKARLVNAADAAAYSGVQWQARALNFQAYTNRAMVANQVSMAQAVTLESWTTYGRIMSENLSTVLSAVPFVNAIAAGVESVMAGVDQVVSPIAGAMLTVIDGINTGIGLSQQAMFLSSFAATPEIVEGVVSATDERFSVDTRYSVLGALDNLAAWDEFTDSVGNGEADYGHMRDRAELIRESQDAFTRNRDWEFFDSYLYIAPGVKINLEREGRTELIERVGDDGLEWEWKAKDTLSFHSRINLFFTRERVEVPIGYAGAFANDEGDDESIQDDERMLDANELAEDLLDENTPGLSGSDSLIPMSGYNGLRAFRRLSDETRGNSFPTLALRVEVAMPLSESRTTNDSVSGDVFETPLAARGDLTSSISIAEAYFKPPDADLWLADDALEFANEYGPWWDVRLAPIAASERLAAFALRDAGSSVPPDPQRVPTRADALPTYETDGAELLPSGGSTGASNVAAAVAQQYGDRATDALASQIEEQLTEALRDAVADILAGLARGAAESAIGADNLATVEAVGDYLDDLEQEADTEQLAADVETARADIDALQAEFARVDAVLEAEFGPFFMQQTRRWIGSWRATQQRLNADANYGYTLFGVPPDSALEDLLWPTASEVRVARAELLDELAAEYNRLVTATSDRVEMDERMARQIVSLLLSALNDAEGGDIDFGLFGDV